MSSKEPRLRISTRLKKLSLKAQESTEFIQKLQKCDGIEISDSENSIAEESKPKILSLNEAAAGGKIFSFQTRKSRKSLAQKVEKIKKQGSSYISQEIKQINSSNEDWQRTNVFSDSSESEYEPTENSDSDTSDVHKIDTSNEEHNSSSSDEEDRKHSVSRTKVRSQFKQSGYTSHKKTMETNNHVPSVTSKEYRKCNKLDKKYIIKTDDYFANQSSKKRMTSNHTLDKLETPRLPQDKLHSIIKDMKINPEHVVALNDLKLTNTANFRKWLFILHENFNILLYGLGCKRSILNEFHKQYLKDLPVVVVNGFFPTLTIKDVLDNIIVDILELAENHSNAYDACDLIKQEFDRFSDYHLYLIIHNIDGETLRNKKAQDVFAKLASVKNVHLIASIDHINAPLIWDHLKLSKLKFIWWDATSYLPYIEETSYESSLMVQKSGNSALSSLRNVFMSLTSNSKSIYLQIVEHQLENAKNPYYQGLAFKDLYWSCREAFLVSSDLALKAQLTEFVDHKMVKYRRSADGIEFLIIPLPNTLLQQFLKEQKG